jgi:hypothetical protein
MVRNLKYLIKHLNRTIMPRNHEADMNNSNSGTSGTNDTYQQNQDNRADQLNPNNDKYQD